MNDTVEGYNWRRDGTGKLHNLSVNTSSDYCCNSRNLCYDIISIHSNSTDQSNAKDCFRLTNGMPAGCFAAEQMFPENPAVPQAICTATHMANCSDIRVRAYCYQ